MSLGVSRGVNDRKQVLVIEICCKSFVNYLLMLGPLCGNQTHKKWISFGSCDDGFKIPVNYDKPVSWSFGCSSICCSEIIKKVEIVLSRINPPLSCAHQRKVRDWNTRTSHFSYHKNDARCVKIQYQVTSVVLSKIAKWLVAAGAFIEQSKDPGAPSLWHKRFRNECFIDHLPLRWLWSSGKCY